MFRKMKMFGEMKKGSWGFWMKKVALLVGMVGLLVLTGCPRGVSQEEQDAINLKADECLKEALATHCGLKEGSYEIMLSEFGYWGYPQPIKKYQLRVGEDSYQAVVWCEEPYRTYTNYNSAGFEDMLKEYMKEKPIPRSESIVSAGMLTEIIISASAGALLLDAAGICPPALIKACGMLIQTLEFCLEAIATI